MTSSNTPRFTALGKFVSVLLVVGLIGLGAYMLRGMFGGGSGGGAQEAADPGKSGGTPEVAEVKVSVPTLSPPGQVQLKDNVVPIEISEYAGYAGLIAANGGLDPNENSVFFKRHGFKVKLTISEDENWSELNEGKIAASVTTADVLAVYGRQLHAVVPAQIGFSRGADGVVVRSDIKRINALKGKAIATAQFTEADFFIRYLAQEAGLEINTLGSLDATPHPDRVNLIYAETGEDAGKLFLADLKAGKNRLAGAVTWEPMLSEVLDGSNNQAHVLTTNRNLLIVADVLIVHKTFAEQNPKIVAGLVEGLLEGNRMVRDRPDAYYDVVAHAFKWKTAADAKAELAQVHLSNLPENLAFFSGQINEAGSFSGIYQSAVLAYGSDLIRNPLDASRFADTQHLTALEKSGLFKDQKIAIAPIRMSTGGGSIETNPLLTKDIRFLFEPNKSDLDMSDAGNIKNLEAIKKLVQISPGSTLLLRGHVDNLQAEKFKRDGQAVYQRASLEAMKLSKDRAGEIRRLLIEKYQVDPKRIEVVGRGWEEPAGTDSAANRRVEVQWFTIE
jgi:NitT/TauT family transport system substrate-binding protein